MASLTRIEMQVDHHPSGRFTLKERKPGEVMWKDVKEVSPLFENTDPASFYRAVAQRMASYSADDIKITSYRDATL